jgi:hypothetical protein
MHATVIRLFENAINNGAPAIFPSLPFIIPLKFECWQLVAEVDSRNDTETTSSIEIVKLSFDSVLPKLKLESP